MSELVGKTVTTGKRNQNQNEGMAPKDISLPNFAKPFSAPAPAMGKRDTTLDAGGSATPDMKG